MQKAWLIYNPGAGRFPAGPFLGRAVKVLGKAGWDVKIVNRERDSDLSLMASEAIHEGCHTVFVVGGDGSVGQMAGSLAGSSTALGVLPAGTANVWAQELGLPQLGYINLFALEKAASLLANGQVQKVDLGECNGQYFLLWAGVGLDAQIVNSIEPRGRKEKLFPIIYYGTKALWTTIGWEGLELEIHTAERSWTGKYLTAVACNIPAYAGGLLDLAPGAKVDDGILDFWLLEGESLKDLVIRLIQVFRGTHVDAPGVDHFRADEATFITKSSMPMQFDGEPVMIDSPIRFKVHRRALRVLVPAGTEQRLFSS
ncbi:MAG: diacylglycerol kinase family lipid kinase [Anaerolineaceae bacterium]|nr:MAG: diacylglycerol kinase family lipid kinase [Anaerolineaceae bacterium]